MLPPLPLSLISTVQRYPPSTPLSLPLSSFSLDIYIYVSVEILMSRHADMKIIYVRLVLFDQQIWRNNRTAWYDVSYLMENRVSFFLNYFYYQVKHMNLGQVHAILGACAGFYVREISRFNSVFTFATRFLLGLLPFWIQGTMLNSDVQ